MAASSSSRRCRYDVFLSFRGADTRKGFTDHLYQALESAGIHTFRDDDEIERGANVAAELERAIQESRVAVIVFSEDYASSTWCLDELAKIMERSKSDGLMVVPVFYKVDPSEVRKQTGSFGEAFVRLEERFKEETGKVEVWRKALKDVADLAGIVSGHRYESQLIKEIVEKIGDKLEPKLLNVASHEVGIDDRVEEINMWLRDESTNAGVAGIYGMGGIGKTTIAKAAYNLNLGRFEGSSFLADFRETSKQPNGLVRLQMKLLSDIQKNKPKEIYDVNDGMNQIKKFVCCKKVLIVLDDVDDSDQLSAIIGMREWFYPGSKIIITTRDLQLLKTNDVSEMFKVRELDKKESLVLLSWHAFKRAHPTESYMEVSTDVVQHCEGLPLAIKVLGSSLFGKSVDAWKDTMKRLAIIPDGGIQNVLRISFDGLQDDLAKRLFLHVACFFVGKEESVAVTVLDSLDFFPISGIPNLVDKCLLEITGYYKHMLMMHQLLIDMAWGIVREESPEYPGKRSRVRDKDASNVLENISGTETIKGLMVNLPKENILSETISQRKNKRCQEENDGNYSRRRGLSFFTWKSDNSSSSEFDSCKPNFKTEAFKGMNNLQLLLLNNVKLSGSYDDFPQKISWLSWQGLRLQSLPNEFPLRNVVVLELQNSNLQLVWEGKKNLPKLKILDLSRLVGLVTTPDFSGLSNLERLILKGCTNIKEVDESIGDLEKLVLLDLEDCKYLNRLPKTMERLTSLQKLNFSGCSNLAVNANTATDMKKFFSRLSFGSWQSIWSRVSPRKSIIESTGLSWVNLPHSLVHLCLASCNLTEIPYDLSILSSLKKLDLRKNPFIRLPENIRSLRLLESLDLSWCQDLIILPETPPNLYKLSAIRRTSLKEVTNLPNRFTRLFLNLFGCRELVKVEGLYCIKPLSTEVDAEVIRKMGFYNLGTVECNQEYQMLNCMTKSMKRCPLQGLYEFGIFSIFLHGRKIPDWYDYKGETALSIIVPSHPTKLKIIALNVCVVYTEYIFSVDHPLVLRVSNEAKGLMWSYSPVSFGKPKKNEEMSWLSHWQFENDELEGGEELRFSADYFSHYSFERATDAIKELGVQVVYEHENEGNASNDIQSSNPEDVTNQHDEAPYSSQDISTGYVSDPIYQTLPGEYFLSNNDLMEFANAKDFSNTDFSNKSNSICFSGRFYVTDGENSSLHLDLGEPSPTYVSAVKGRATTSTGEEGWVRLRRPR